MGRLGWALVWIAVLASCGGRLDSDHDGYESDETGGTDCDDRRPDVHPGAAEVPGGRLESSVLMTGEWVAFLGGDWLSDAAIVDGSIAVLYWQRPDLVVARREGDDWSREVVGSGEYGMQRWARLAPDGSVHMVWRVEDGSLWHATNSSGQWIEQTIPEVPTTGDWCATFEPNGSPLVVFADAAGGMGVARRDSDDHWSVWTAAMSPVRRISQCATDGSGRAHVVVALDGAAAYAIEDTAAWRVESPPQFGPFALDESGAAHMAAGQDGLTYVTNAGGEWQSEHVSGEVESEFPQAVAVAPAGTVHVLTVRRQERFVEADVTYARRAGTWVGPVPLALTPRLGGGFLFADDDSFQIVDLVSSPIGDSQWREAVQLRVTRSLPYDEDCNGIAE